MIPTLSNRESNVKEVGIAIPTRYYFLEIQRGWNRDSNLLQIVNPVLLVITAIYKYNTSTATEIVKNMSPLKFEELI